MPLVAELSLGPNKPKRNGEMRQRALCSSSLAKRPLIGRSTSILG
jgi:hypothetical protein